MSPSIAVCAPEGSPCSGSKCQKSLGELESQGADLLRDAVSCKGPGILKPTSLSLSTMSVPCRLEHGTKELHIQRKVSQLQDSDRKLLGCQRTPLAHSQHLRVGQRTTSPPVSLQRPSHWRLNMASSING